MESHGPGSSVPAAQNVTVDEVIGAYKQACQKLNCRQIPKLLRQLQVRQAGEGPLPGARLSAGCGERGEGVPGSPPAPAARPAQVLRTSPRKARLRL